MKNKILPVLIATFLITGIANCANPNLRGTYVSSSRDKKIQIVSDRRVSGSSCQFSFLGIPISPGHDVQEAFDRALAIAWADDQSTEGLANVAIKLDTAAYILIGHNCYVVSGTPAKRQ